MNHYEYNYHDLADNAYYIEDIDSDAEDTLYEEDSNTAWDNYYHNLADELIDE